MNRVDKTGWNGEGRRGCRVAGDGAWRRRLCCRGGGICLSGGCGAIRNRRSPGERGHRVVAACQRFSSCGARGGDCAGEGGRQQ
eukprot:6745432-Lingulodinium_polyedra.AAC.1